MFVWLNKSGVAQKVCHSFQKWNSSFSGVALGELDTATSHGDESGQSPGLVLLQLKKLLF